MLLFFSLVMIISFVSSIESSPLIDSLSKRIFFKRQTKQKDVIASRERILSRNSSEIVNTNTNGIILLTPRDYREVNSLEI